MWRVDLKSQMWYVGIVVALDLAGLKARQRQVVEARILPRDPVDVLLPLSQEVQNLFRYLFADQ